MKITITVRDETSQYALVWHGYIWPPVTARKDLIAKAYEQEKEGGNE